MTLTATERPFLHIAKVAVSDGEVTAESVDWPAIFTLANQQKLLPILFEAAQSACRCRKRGAVRRRQAAGHRAGAAPDHAGIGICRTLPEAPRGGTAPGRGQGSALQPTVSAVRSPHQRGRRSSDSGRRISRLPRTASGERLDHRRTCGRAGIGGRGALHERRQPALHRAASAFI